MKMEQKKKSLLVVGTVAIDSIETPYGKQEECFGGSAAYFAYAASFFTPIKLSAVVGEDFPREYQSVLEERAIDLTSLEFKKGGKTFRWQGSYKGDMNEAKTLETHLNVLEHFNPLLSKEESHEYVFLANIDPVIQEKVLDQAAGDHLKLVACDTMNFWITTKQEELKKVMKKIHVMILNDGEARQLTGEANVIKAGRQIQAMGPAVVVVKKGEHGSLLFHYDSIFAAPAFPCESVFDPTGAGDSFAGGLMGYLACTGDVSFESFKRAVVYGNVMASFTVEDFSLNRLRRLSNEEIENRLGVFRQMVSF